MAREGKEFLRRVEEETSALSTSDIGGGGSRTRVLPGIPYASTGLVSNLISEEGRQRDTPSSP